MALAQTDSVSRQLAKLGMKIGDLAFETVLLIQILEAGSPTPIVAIFTIIIASNALACATTMFLPFQRIGLIETLVDLLFDLLIVVVLPDELRRCTELRHLTLEYTHTQTLPDWFKGFTELEFLHLESKFTSPFVVLPDDIFRDMSSFQLSTISIDSNDY
ncbi:hypothetical protein PC114_g20257 [Phytophthora cactorum]|nr:hypothetical protein PC114_g20257 [Phytophthora cactorum]